MVIVLIGIIGSLALTATILAVVFTAIRRGIDREVAQLDHVIIDSGPTTMTTRFHQFRSETLHRGGLRRNNVRVVLTATHLHLVERPQRYGVFERSDLPAFTVGVESGALSLRSTNPPRATGTIDYRIEVDDPARWVEALVSAGARPR